MIHNNASGIFQGKAMGVDDSNADDPDASFEENYSKDNLTRVLQPVGFDDKVMGGQRSSFFLEGKMPGIGGAQEYSQRLKFLTKQSGGYKMSEKMSGSNMSGFFGNSEDPLKKVSSMTKNNGSNNKNLISGLVSSSKNDLSGILGGSKNNPAKLEASVLGGKKLGTSGFDMNSMFSASTTKNKTNNIMKDFFKTTGKNNDFMKNFSASNKFDFNKFVGAGVGARALPGLDMKHEFNVQNKVSANAGFDMNMTKNNALDKINNAIGVSNVNKLFKTGNQKLGGEKSKFADYFKSGVNTDPSKMFERTGVDINRMMGGFGNPEKASKKRLRQQRGLSMFGDYDGDKLANILDCDPLDARKQGEQHKLTSYMGGKDLVTVGDTDVATTQPAGAPSVYDDDERGVEPAYAVPRRMSDDSESGFENVNMGSMPYYEPDSEQSYGDVAADTDAYRGFDYNDFTGGAGKAADDSYNDDDAGDEYEQVNINNQDGYTVENEGFNWSESKRDTDKKQGGADDIGIDAQIRRVTRLMGQAEKSSERRKYADILKTLYHEKRLEDDAGTKRDKDLAKNINEYMFKTDELGLKKKQFDVDKMDRAEERKLKTKKFERDTELQDRKFKLQKQQMRADREKGQMALWENKLKAGTNMLGSLIGGSGKPKDYGDVTGVSKMGGTNLAKGTANVVGGLGSTGLSTNASALTGMNAGSSAYAIAESVGEGGYNASFGQKVMESVGDSGQGSNYNAKVGESLGGQSVDEVKEQQALRRRMQEQMQAGMMQQSQQPVQPQMQRPQFEPRQRPIPQPQPQMRPSMQRPQHQQQSSYGAPRIDWDTVSPNQAAQFDPEYAEYLKESNAKYRRGPYKKG